MSKEKPDILEDEQGSQGQGGHRVASPRPPVSAGTEQHHPVAGNAPTSTSNNVQLPRDNAYIFAAPLASDSESSGSAKTIPSATAPPVSGPEKSPCEPVEDSDDAADDRMARPRRKKLGKIIALMARNLKLSECVSTAYMHLFTDYMRRCDANSPVSWTSRPPTLVASMHATSTTTLSNFSKTRHCSGARRRWTGGIRACDNRDVSIG
ncbi:hypothetical protein OH77DRAFT_1425079 [Trametes cingulata]|nr:hypothetical protein OH77DRAFT_1425079 [Trametes cingulata]